MPFDFKKEYREFYLPKDRPEIVTVPPMNYLAVRGAGDPNAEGSDYKASIALLYGVAYTIKMSRKAGRRSEGFFDYVVPPLEGFWWQKGTDGVDYTRKEAFEFLSVIRLPDFVRSSDVQWAVETASVKKKADYSPVQFLTVEEGLCVQCMHLGPYDDEPATVARMHGFIAEKGFIPDFSDSRLHHEIYLSDARKVPPERCKTVIRHPIRPVSS